MAALYFFANSVLLGSIPDRFNIVCYFHARESKPQEKYMNRRLTFAVLSTITLLVTNSCGSVPEPAHHKPLSVILPKPESVSEEEPPAPVVDPPIWNTPAEVEAACKTGLEKAESLKKYLLEPLSPRTRKNTLEPVNNILIEIYTLLSSSELMANVHPNKSVRDAAETCQQNAMKFVTAFELDRDIYDAILAVKTEGLDPIAARFTKHMLRDYRLSGVDKDEETRKKLANLREEMVKVGQDFSRTIREDKRSIDITKRETAGLPADLISSHKVKKGTYRFTTDYPDFMPLVNYADRESVRKAIYLEYLRRGHPANDENLKKLLTLRHTYAQILGYGDWASYAAVDMMANSKKIIAEFIDKVADIARPRMKKDIATLLERKQKDNKKSTQVRVWDRFYYANKIKAERFDMDPKQLREYFDYTKVLDGLLTLSQELFGVTFEKVDAPVWHEEVAAYNVLEAGKIIGRFYLDMHPREGKYTHAAEFGMVTGIANRFIPSASLVCNFPRPTPETPALLEHDQVTTIFHEFGHLLHQILAGRQEWVTLSGISCERDFVEAPSQLYEHWAWEHEVLKRFATHHETGKPIPQDLVKKMKDADEFGRGAHVMRQMYYAGLSFHYHATDPASITLLDIVKQMQEKYSPYPYENDTYVYASFGHLEGYGSSYYTYMWSLSLSEDIFTRFQHDGLLNQDTAMAYRKSVLDPGGTVDAIDMVRHFLGREPSFDALEAYLKEGM